MKSTKSFVDVTALVACHRPIEGKDAITCDDTKVLLPSISFQVIYFVLFSTVAA
jgi:hypothetical protein